MGVKLGAAMGAEVTVLSQSLKKMEDGLRLGAKHYYATSDRDTFKKLRNSFDLILNTVSANLDLGDYLSLLDVDGTLVELGIPGAPHGSAGRSRWRWRAAACPGRTSAASPRPRRCSTSAPSTT